MPAVLIFAGCCAQNIPSPNDMVVIKQVCEPIYGRASDWDNISDDLARNIYRHNRQCEEFHKK